MKKIAVFVFSILLFTGCSTLSVQQKQQIDEYKAKDLYVQEKNPSTAASLGLVLGFGSFYVNKPGMGILDLLLWPPSILWDPFIAFAEAEQINYRATLKNVDVQYKARMRTIERDLEDKKISEKEFLTQKRAIEDELDKI